MAIARELQLLRGLILLVYWAADFSCAQLAPHDFHVLRVAIDTTAHAVLAALVWQITTGTTGGAGVGAAVCFESYWSGALGSLLVDSDHLFAAGSLSLSAAASLSVRPYGHSLLALAVATMAAAAAGAGWSRRSGSSRRWAVLAGSAYFVHLLRDGVRRGVHVLPAAWALQLVSGGACSSGGGGFCLAHYLQTPPLPLWLVQLLYLLLPWTNSWLINAGAGEGRRDEGRRDEGKGFRTAEIAANEGC
ncbi:hypothetical protein B484DRAFT_407047 [Ochromonadaceae sp. CCMP2298]|nr:hypothetical protein B484DRAFT_407047 [Ochromonadaceae sp. CCMP2298]|mmetsp:Transcript_11489/g.25499  ORF Transcript_11489/g.25499 Transcript_11489/m.25499 type:complete len:247 (-) Transcript_11489:70-810(-)